MAMGQGVSPAAEQVRRLDRERFVTALLAPAEARERLMVLYAFNAEVARVSDSVREPLAGLVRLQWWRDLVAGARRGEAPPHHPIAAPLSELVRTHDLPEAAFDRLLTAREHDLYLEPHATLEALEVYAAATSTELTQLALRLLGGDGEVETRAANHIGIAWALAGLARALPFRLSTGRVTLPEDVLARAGTSAEAVLAGRADPAAIAAATREVAARAAEHLAAARKIRVSRRALPALLPATLARGHLRTLEKAGWNPFDSRVAMVNAMPLRLLLASVRGRV